MTHGLETEIENKLGRIVGACFDAILLTLTEAQEQRARDFLRRVVANPNVYRDDKRILAIIAGSTDEELDQLMTELYGPRPPQFQIIQGGGNSAA